MISDEFFSQTLNCRFCIIYYYIIIIIILLLLYLLHIYIFIIFIYIITICALRSDGLGVRVEDS